MRDERYEVHLRVDVGEEPQAEVPAPDEPFCIALLGDFSGRANRGLVEIGAALAGRRAVLVDRDNLDEALARFAPELELPLGGETDPHISVRFAEIEDFHPDRLYERLPVFQSLRDTRQRLADPTTFAEALRELQAESGSVPAEAETPAARPVPDNLLDQIIGETSDRPPAASSFRSTDLRAFVERAVAPHLVPGPDPQQAEMLAQVDAATGAQMRTILHHPDMQSLEALWRGIFFLARRIETSSQLQLYLIDVTKEEMIADQAPDSEFEASGLYHLLVESSVGTPGGKRWAMLAGAYSFGGEPEDAALLGRLAAIARLAAAPWISAADPRLAGCESLHATPDPAQWTREIDPAWTALRRAPEASSLGLALPRFLLRLPYGAETEPCELFPFEETVGAPAHEQYLWGNPAFACVVLLAASFSASGWTLRPSTHLDIDNLPLHLVDMEGEIRAKPCAEALLTERAAVRLLESGLMPLLSFKDRDTARLARFQSAANPPTPLAGRWTNAVRA